MTQEEIDKIYPEFNKSYEEIYREAQELFIKTIKEKLSVKKYSYDVGADIKTFLQNVSQWETNSQIRDLFINKVKDSILHKKCKKMADDHEQFKVKKCEHPELFVSKKYGSNIGNYDPSQDRYWIDFTCHLCNKKWTTNQ